MNPVHQHENNELNREFQNIYRLLDDLTRFKADISDTVQTVRNTISTAGNGFGFEYGTYVGANDAVNNVITAASLLTIYTVIAWRSANSEFIFRGTGWAANNSLQVDAAPGNITTAILSFSGNTFTVLDDPGILDTNGQTYHWLAFGTLA